jgi:hypothetical protein
MEKNNELLVTMTQGQLEDLIYYTTVRASKRALDKHFRGLLPFLDRINDDNEKLLEELDFIKLSLQNGTKTKKPPSPKKKMDKQPVLPAKFFGTMTDEEKVQWAIDLKAEIEKNSLNGSDGTW